MINSDKIINKHAWVSHEIYIFNLMLLLLFLAQLECGPLPPLLNGQILIESGKATYICDLGFSLIGKEYRICYLSNNWSGSQPVCEGMAHDYCMIVICGLVLSSSPRTGNIVQSF